MTEPAPVYVTQRPQMPPEQWKQLLALLAAALKHGWMVLEIEIKDHHVKEFRTIERIPAARDES